MSKANRARFHPTRWSVVLAASDPTSPGSDAALAELCAQYWFPVYSFIRRSRSSAEEAADLTQAFFTRLLEKNFLRTARRERGKFRSFLLASVTHFLANEHDWRSALKRGGGQRHLSLEFDDGERRYHVEPIDQLTPDRVFERQWALEVLDLAMASLASRHADRSDVFERLKPFLIADADTPYSIVASELGMAEGAVRVAVHRLRKEFGSVLRDVIADTVGADEQVDEELKYLLSVVSH